MTAYRMGKDLHQSHIRQRSDLKNIQKLKKLDTKRTNNNKKKWSTDLNRELSTEESKMAERHLRKCSTFLAIREMQIKTTLGIAFLLGNMVTRKIVTK